MHTQFPLLLNLNKRQKNLQNIMPMNENMNTQ